MKLICNKKSINTTIGKTYEIIEYSDSYGDIGYYFIGDDGKELIYFTHNFITIEQFRENQLNEIGV
jgi:hypothetical protein